MRFRGLRFGCEDLVFSEMIVMEQVGCNPR